MQTRTFALCLALSTLGVGCASAPPALPPAAARHYSPAQVKRIMALRERGDSLADVAEEVGGSRLDVRLAERQELARRRPARGGPGAVPAELPIGNTMIANR